MGLIFEKPFRNATNEDVKSLVGKIETNELANFVNRVSKCGKNEWSDWTKRDYRVVLKKFYKWLTDDENPSQIKGIKSSARNGNHRLPEEILTRIRSKSFYDRYDGNPYLASKSMNGKPCFSYIRREWINMGYRVNRKNNPKLDELI